MTRVLSIAGVLASTLLVLSGCRGPGAQSPDEGPEQPIAFYHSVHAGENQIPCMYCHYTAERSPSAGIPTVQLCVGCHVPGSAVVPPEQAQLAFPGPDRDSLWHAEATELVGYWQRQEAIPWVRVHKLPEHVRFPHSSHVRVGLQCQTCHGPVEEMEKVYQFSSLQMGWCVDCHRGELPISEEEERTVRERSSFVREIMVIAQQEQQGRQPGATPGRESLAQSFNVAGQQLTYPNQRASTDCMVCHY